MDKEKKMGREIIFCFLWGLCMESFVLVVIRGPWSVKVAALMSRELLWGFTQAG